MQLKSLFFTYVECQMFEVYHIRTVQMYNNKHETYLKTHVGPALALSVLNTTSLDLF